MKLRTKTWFLSCGLGTLLGTLPQILAKLPTDSNTFDHLIAKLSYLLAPGLLFNFLLSGWHVHDTELAPLLVGSSVFYSLVIYGVIALRKKLLGLSASSSQQRT